GGSRTGPGGSLTSGKTRPRFLRGGDEELAETCPATTGKTAPKARRPSRRFRFSSLPVVSSPTGCGPRRRWTVMPFARGTPQEPPRAATRRAPASPGQRAKRRGATSVEFALAAPLLFLIFFALVEVARGLMVAHLLDHAARLGARAGVIEGTS